MRQEDSFFGERELVLIYIAKRLREALKVEQELTSAGLDYLVETDTYVGGFLFRSERAGAFFYVDEATTEPARRLLIKNGRKPYSAEPAN